MLKEQHINNYVDNTDKSTTLYVNLKLCCIHLFILFFTDKTFVKNVLINKKYIRCPKQSIKSNVLIN